MAVTPNSKRQRTDGPPELQPRTYELQRVLGQGSYGTVYQAAISETGDVVAVKVMKPVRHDEATGKACYTREGPDREVQILKELNGHPNIVELKGAFVSDKDKPAEAKLHLVFEFLSDTLHRVIKHTNQLQKSIDATYVKMYFYQTMRGLAYMHGKGIAHCDLKPQNLLLDGKTHGLRICDFGTAIRLSLGERRSLYICSRYFRAPEIILGSTCYNTSIDLWSAGCILGEMIIRQPLFTGRDGVDQLVEIIKVIGTPSVQEMKAMNPNYQNYEFTPKLAPHNWDKVLKGNAPPHAADLMNQLVRYDPQARLPPLQCLLHPYHDELREARNPMHRILFDFLPDELVWATRAERQKLIPQWAAVKKQV